MKIQNTKGITLIALIITIVVLLILAGVAIGTLQQSNIIGQAQSAASEYNQAKENETDELANYGQELEKYFPKESKIKYYKLQDTIQMVDYKNSVCTTYFFDDITGEYKKSSDINFAIGEPITEVVQIDLYDITNSTVNKKDLKVGTIPSYVEDFPIGYIEDNILYGFMVGEDYYVAFELVEDKDEIAAIEAGIK